QAYLCDSLEDKQWMWAPATEIHSLVTERSWGGGDLTDLRSLIIWSCDQGAGTVVPGSMQHSPGSMFIDPVYLDVEKTADYHEYEDVKRKVLAPSFQARLAEMRRHETDLEVVRSQKLLILEELFQHFCHTHLAKGSERARQFRHYCERMAESLWRF